MLLPHLNQNKVIYSYDAAFVYAHISLEIMKHDALWLKRVKYVSRFCSQTC